MSTITNSSSSSGVVNITTEMPAKFVLFGHEFPSGDVEDLFRRLHRCSKLRRFPLLALFLDECTIVLREEIQKLPQQLRPAIPPFHDIITLSSYFNELTEGQLGDTWKGAFLCIYEIAMLIRYYESESLQYDLVAPTTCLAGISIGLFAATAAAISTSISDLVSYGAKSVRVAFAFCVHVNDVSQFLETRAPAEAPPSWAMVVTGLPVEEVQAELDRFNSEAPTLTQVSISHVDHSSVGVTGPPARLAKLFCQSQVLGSSRHSSLPISGGLCHVPSLYSEDDVNAILEAAGVQERWKSGIAHLPLLSPYTGVPFPADNAVDLLRAICTESLTKPLFFDKIAEGVVEHVLNLEPPECRVLHYRTSLISDQIISAVTEKLSCIPVRRQDLVEWAMKDEIISQETAPRSPHNSNLAVVGMACRMPGGADTPERFWQLLVDGRDTHTTVPADRFDIETHYDPTGKTENSTNTRYGNFIDNPGYFDAGFFNMSPREAQQTDPMQRLALVTAYEALEMAGFVPNRTPSSHVSRVGTYYGQASDDYREVNASQKISTYGITGTERAFGNGRINYFFNFSGPSFNIDTACSSGLAAIQAACSALWAGEVDTVVAGGLNVITNPDIYCMLTKGHFLSKTGQCKVWDAGADGYCRADGVGSVVIKRLEDAEADNDVVLATIVAGATNHSAESISITHPHAGAQMDNYRQVMRKAVLSPLDVSYVELHGTGTQAGDAVESESVVNVFAPLGRRQHPEQRLHLGALKANSGHGEAAAGVASLIKVLLMYRHGIIPRHIGISTTINPVVAKHLANRNAGVVSENTPWPRRITGSDRRGGKKRYAIVNSFGAHGGNTTLLLEDPPTPSHHDLRPRTVICQVVCISAKSKVSLRGNIETMLRYLDANPDTDLRDIAYTTCARRMHHHTRVAAAVSSTTQLRKFLRAAADNIDSQAKHVSLSTPRTVVFAFSGQGSFYEGAGAQLFEHAPFFRDQVRQLDHLVCKLGFPSILAAITGARTENFPTTRDSSDSETSDDTEDLAPKAPLVTQLAILVLQIALARYWQALVIAPNVVIGHSFGEYAALVIAGVLSVADAILLVGKRAELLLAACEPGSHAMLFVRGASVNDIAEICKDKKCQYEISCLNGHSEVVISGTHAEIQALRDVLHDAGLKCILLDVPFAFHSAQMDPILDDFERLAQHVTFKPPVMPIVSPLLKQCVVDDGIITPTYLRRAAREPVIFTGALDAARIAGIVDDNTAWIDIGAHPVCTSFVRNHYAVKKTHTFAALRKGDDKLCTLMESLAALHCLGLPVAWNEYFAPHEKSYRLLHLDHYHWDEKNYWIPYIGTWTLDKAHPQSKKKDSTQSSPSFFTSSVQQIVSEEIGESTGRLIALSDMTHPDFLKAVDGHRMNGRCVVAGSIWADMALTIGEYLYNRMVPNAHKPCMSVDDMEVLEASVVIEKGQDNSTPQLIQVEGAINLPERHTLIRWYSARADGSRSSDKPFATATVRYEDLQVWRAEWKAASHLVASRAESLWKMASGMYSSQNGSVSRLSQSMVYQLFRNVVDYGTPYRGMQCVALAEDTQEATADIVLNSERYGTWHTPPHWIDGAFQLAGFVMNAFGVNGEGETTGSSRDSFYVTPGWRHLRLAEPLEPGPDTCYRSYVRMFAIEGQPGAFSGDIYLLRGEDIVGVCAGIKFKRVPRALMSVMFPPQDSKKGIHGIHFVIPCSFPYQPSIHRQNGTTVKPTVPDQIEGENPQVAGCLRLIASETGLDIEDLSSEAAFTQLGVDSLMSLVLSEKIHAELGIKVKASIFLECATVRDLVEWLRSQ
ncbi:polyketide synthase [Hypoxylon sp. FL0890]|nr:polyketide synthase [Hypoxylon sp. FL0890]